MDFSLADELQQSSEEDYQVPFDFGSMDPNEVNASLNSIVDTITGESSAIQEQDVYDTLRSLLKHIESLQGPTINKLLDAICSGFSNEIDATSRDNDPTDHTAYRSHQQALEMYAFLLQWFVVDAERMATKQAKADEQIAGAPKKKGKATKSTGKKRKDDFTWTESIPEALGVMAKALRLRTERIWQTAPERDTFISNCFLKPANLLAESEVYMKTQDIKMGIYKIICVAAKNHGQAFGVQMTIMQNLQYAEHLSEPMAELVTILNKEFDYSQLGEDVLREIAARQFNTADSKGPRSFSKFLVRLAEISPRLVLKQIALLQKHLDSESYPMRNAILEVIGLLIRELSITEGLDLEPEQQKRQLEAFFDLLFERFLDLNSFVRSKVAGVLLKTCELPTKQPKLRMKLTDLTIRSLEDKSSQVRKNCISLLTKLILTHPYGMHGGELCLSEWQARYKALEDELKVLDLPAVEEAEAMREARELMEDPVEEEAEGEGEGEDEDKENEPTEEDEGEDSDGSDLAATPKKRHPRNSTGGAKSRASRGPRPSALDLAGADQSQLLAQVDQDTLTRLRLTKKYYADAIAFIEQLTRGMDVVEDLLASTVKGEVLEAMEFFKVASQYKIEAAHGGVKRMLHLIWSKDEATTEEDGKEVKGIRSRLIECYSQLYFEPQPDLTEKEQVIRVAQNVIELTRDATLAELTSLEQLLGVMMSKGVVEDEVIAKLWQVYSSERAIPKFQRRGAIIVLGMFAGPKPEVVADHVETLLKIGLGPHGKLDLVLAKYTCTALSRVAGSVKKVKGSLDDVSVRLPMDSPVFARLASAIQHPSSNKEWFSMAEQAVNTIYALGDQPDALCSAVLRDMTMRVFGPQGPTADAAEDVEKDEDTEMDVDDKEDADEEDQLAPAATVAGSVAGDMDDDATPTPSSGADNLPTTGSAFSLSQLIFVAGHCAIKQLVHLELVERDIKRRKAEEDKKAGAAGKAAGQDELDQVAGSVEDEIGDVIAATKERELLYGPESLLAVFGPMAAMIVSQPKVYNNPMLKTAATLALSKFMCVSAQFCEEHLMMLFKVLETSREPAVRSNIVIALGDIAVCFSTIMDENSDRLYAGLHDKDLTVKKNTLMVLTHLILNGMIKVKGQLGEMAKCLEDEDKRISDLAHLFFTELSTKDKAIYNNLPDIISHLSSGANPVDEETFCKSMKFIFTFVDKKREAESIVEKLCQRFQVATEARQWRDIAFCLSLLPFNSEIAVKKLVEGLPFYQDKLHEETVFKRFQEILTKANSNKVSKNEQDLKEFADALEEHRAKGSEEQEMARKVQKSKKKATKGKARPRRKAVSESPPSSPER
ncbi:non-SMC mitotic condensation complex subunit 1-domain-containing protein [Leucosporidium creatinivorum]|uniref:Condensin complex subunit 1 n=1 Tax=Leucosporidium creatinivorum TaxID=106004 RepID=A0A1Y2G5Q3_9BASI|nr:non-SMC mitotic condensation complex subunit 1-domain-containing protein [Leucosporidium creatinivorum]